MPQAEAMSKNKQSCGEHVPGRTGASLALAFEVLAVASAVGVAVVLSLNHRATALHISSVWLGAGASALPLLIAVSRARRSLTLSVVVVLLVLGAIGGCYTIGGIGLAIPAFFVLVGGVVDHVSAPGLRAMRRRLRRVMFGLALGLVLGGLVSVGAGVYLVPVGLVLLVGAALLSPR